MEKLSKKFSLGTEEYGRRAKEVFPEYDYSMPDLILRGYGCPWCSAEANNSIYIKDTDDLKTKLEKYMVAYLI